MITVSKVQEGSYAEIVGIKSGDKILSINSREINDYLDYTFETTSPKLDIVLLQNGEEKKIHINKNEYESFGIEAETFLMDKKKRCQNACMFCFIDQNPKGMRESIYFKDDDERLSFLQGNYVTLTNLKERDIDRIIEMRISPINVSVHTMNGTLRMQMMKNKNAGNVLEYLSKLSEGGIEINAQLVLCPDVNDGDELSYSLSQLYKLKTLNSVSAVPVGLTKHREGLCKISPFKEETAKAVIETVNKFGDIALKEKGIRTFYASDEFYIKAKLPIPPDSYYEDYPQIENGVGMLRDHKEGFDYALKTAVSENVKYCGRKKTVVTGVAAYDHICSLVDAFLEHYPNAEIKVSRIENRFFGESVTVSGLLTGGDIVSQVENAGEVLLLPENVLKSDEDIFLDNMTLDELQEKLGVTDVYMSGDGESFLDALFK